MKTGFIGLGAMGVGMVRNVAAAGLLQAVYNRSSEKAETLAAELQVAYCQSITDLVRQVDVVLLCVSADQDVIAVVDAIAKVIKPGVTVVDMSTVSSSTAQQCYAVLAEKQAAFLDAPVSGGVEGARKGVLSMMVGGDEAALNQVSPVLQTMAAKITFMGGSGSGQATKAVNQVMAAGINQAVTEALAFAQAQGLPMQKAIQVIAGGAAGNWFLSHRGETMSEGIFEPGFKLALHHKDLAICHDMAERSQCAIPLADQTMQDYQQLMSVGYGDEDISALFRLKRKD